MHLLRIEVENFKSFGGEITIPFDEGFTAITGPNGSGKSNSGDAIQFVLGTRSTKVMRADNVADLIFNGGKHGKPARHMSVTLVFANTPELDGRRRLRVDEDEASFTRSVRLNRKNQPNSSYRIGERSVTATEMRRTLADAGLHGDGYNIVLQGDVTTLAKMTDWKRRGVLEEVAGVTAYDSEIRGANNQRKAVEHDIETIELFEADQKARLKKLEKEREQALKYRDLKEQLDAARIVLAQARYRNRVDEIRMLNEDHQKYLERDQTVRESVRENESRLLTLEEELVKVTRDLEDMATGESKAVMDQIRTLEIEVETSRDRIGDQKRAASDANDEIEVIQGDLDSVLGAVEKLVAEVDAAKQAVEGANGDLDKAEADENEARKAIESGDRHSRDLNRALGLATDEVNKVHAIRAEARLESDRAEQAADWLRTIWPIWKSSTKSSRWSEMIWNSLEKICARTNPLRTVSLWQSNSLSYRSKRLHFAKIAKGLRDNCAKRIAHWIELELRKRLVPQSQDLQSLFAHYPSCVRAERFEEYSVLLVN